MTMILMWLGVGFVGGFLAFPLTVILVFGLLPDEDDQRRTDYHSFETITKPEPDQNRHECN